MPPSAMQISTMATRTRPTMGTGALWRWTLPAIRQAGFWLAVLLPVAYFPLLIDGLEGPRLGVFLVLAVINLLAVVLGADHTPSV